MRQGTFHTSDLNLKYQGLAHMWANMMSRLDDENSGIGMAEYVRKVADFTAKFFEKIQRDRYTFFFEKEEQLSPTRRSPLEGSYPYGRTGKTMRDPLQAFWIFKFSKRGERAPRLIKPGKYTAYHPNADGYADSPYDQAAVQGSRLSRGRSGRYRHIASYTLDELIDLGWDGAMYVTKGRHEAAGNYVPYIPGYDSDADDVYEPIDVQKGKREGVIGLPREEVGLYMQLPDMGDGGQIVQLRRS